MRKLSTKACLYIVPFIFTLSCVSFACVSDRNSIITRKSATNYPFVDPAIKVRAALDITEGLLLFVADLDTPKDLANNSVDDLGCAMACLEVGDEAVDESGEVDRGVDVGSDWSCNRLPTT